MSGFAPQILAAGAAMAGGGAVFLRATFAPRSGIWGPVVWRGDANGPPRLALTFDDGPTPGGTDRILDVLGELNAPGAFFVIGRNVERSPALLARVHAEGHIVGNHTFDHAHFGIFRSGGYWQRQVEKTDAAIEAVIGRRPAMFRPPMGHKTPLTIRAAVRRRQAVVAWSAGALDGLSTTPERILRRLERCSAGEIVMLHDGIEPQSRRDPAATVAAVRPLITRLRNQGFELVRLDRLLRLPAYADAPVVP